MPNINNTGVFKSQRHVVAKHLRVVANSTSQAEGSQGGTAISWAVDIHRNIVIAVDASEVGWITHNGLRNMISFL